MPSSAFYVWLLLNNAMACLGTSKSIAASDLLTIVLLPRHMKAYAVVAEANIARPIIDVVLILLHWIYFGAVALWLR